MTIFKLWIQGGYERIEEVYQAGHRKEDKSMCYNCGCGMPDNPGGDPRNITDKTFEDAAKAAGQSVKEAKANVLKELQKQLGKKK